MKSTTTQDCRTRAPGRPREFDLEHALDKAVRVFCERGYHATSITDLCTAMHLTPGSIYKAFKDKRAIFLAALDRQKSTRDTALQQHLDTACSGRDKVRALLMSYVGISCGLDGPNGCLVVGTAVELAIFDPEIAQRIVASLSGREKLLTELIRAGQCDGSIARTVDVDAVPRLMLCLLQGLMVVGKLSPAYADMCAVVDVAMKVLE